MLTQSQKAAIKAAADSARQSIPARPVRTPVAKGQTVLINQSANPLLSYLRLK